MGFRDLSMFNQALLAKQGWRLLNNPESLLHKVLKAKYFPECSFLEASVPSHSSYAWRSLTQARHIIRMGTRWRVGNGEKVDIWRDNWVCSDTPYKFASPRQILPEAAKVSALINSDSWQWNEALVDTIFIPYEAQMIKTISLHPWRKEDRLIWMGTTNGHFTTKSAYTLQLENKENLMGSSSNQKRLHTYWKGIWGVKIPNKIRVFTWRACHSTLPTRTNLFKRGVVS